MSLLLLLVLGCDAEPPATVPAKVLEPAPPPSEPSTPAVEAAPGPAADANPALLDPSLAVAQAPESFQARFTTTKGDFVIEVDRKLSPNGADRFYNLVSIGYFQDLRFFRVLPGFMVQFGIHGLPAVNTRWKEASIKDDPVKGTNSRGMVSFATSGPDSRTTQIFINYASNANLDGMGFSPFGRVVSGMEVVDALHSYGEGAPKGRGPWQHRIQDEGNGRRLPEDGQGPLRHAGRVGRTGRGSCRLPVSPNGLSSWRSALRCV